MVKKTHLFYLVFVSNLLIACASDKSVDDDRNENLSKKKILNSYPSDLLEANINISSFNGDLLITGQVPRQELVRSATVQANTLRNVREVFNYLQVMGEASFLSKTNDWLITSRIKSRLEDLNLSKKRKIHIVTESGVVYLMGTLEREELEKTLALIKETNGVQKAISLVRQKK
jgi:osmotically-inducible protein OsmY